MYWLLDENLPKDLIDWPRARGDDPLDVADSPHRGGSDRNLWALAGRQSRLVITRDLGFIHWPVQPAPLGVVMVRVPNSWRAPSIVRMVTDHLRSSSDEPLPGHITVLEPGGIRQRAFGGAPRARGEGIG